MTPQYAFIQSLEVHQIRPKQNFGQLVTLLDSDNPHFKYPVVGVLYVWEQGTDLSIISAVFHHQKEDGKLNAPAVVKHPIFTNKINSQP